MEEQRRERFKILFFLVKRDPDKTKKGYLMGSRPGFVCLMVVVALLIITRDLGVERPVFTQSDRTLHNRWKGSQFINATTHPEVNHVALLKVHKTGSSTLQNIFLRYGRRRKLTIALPTFGNKLFPDVPLLDPLQGKNYDILAVHSRFNETVFRSLLPKDTVYIGLAREPLDVMISSAYYNRDVWRVGYLKKVPEENFIQNLIRFPEMYDKNEYSFTKNSMADVFGFPKGLHVTDKVEIKKYLEYLGTIFRLVLITEYFNESLVLMKRYLHWNLSDIVYMPLNEHKHPSLEELNISSIDQGKFKERNYLDYELYNFFHDRFMKQISEESDLLEEVAYFRSVLDKIQLFCLLNNTQEEDHDLIISRSRWNEPFLVTKSECNLMKMSELSFIESLRWGHIQELMNEIS